MSLALLTHWFGVIRAEQQFDDTVLEQSAAILAENQLLIPRNLAPSISFVGKGCFILRLMIFPAENRDEIAQYLQVFALPVV